jgi:hypothetical protein
MHVMHPFCVCLLSVCPRTTHNPQHTTLLSRPVHPRRLGLRLHTQLQCSTPPRRGRRSRRPSMLHGGGRAPLHLHRCTHTCLASLGHRRLSLYRHTPPHPPPPHRSHCGACVLALLPSPTHHTHTHTHTRRCSQPHTPASALQRPHAPTRPWPMALPLLSLQQIRLAPIAPSLGRYGMYGIVRPFCLLPNPRLATGGGFGENGAGQGGSWGRKLAMVGVG